LAEFRRYRPKAMPTGARSPSDASIRRWLAAGIVGASILGIVIVSVVAITTAGRTRAETSRLVFSSVLPLLGTWVGTVLAFYFARENLAAATESTLRLSGIETATPVTSVMIREADFVAYDLGTGDTVDDVPLATLRDKMRALTPPSRRLPIRSASGVVLCVVHDSTLTAYAESQGETTETLTKTLGDLFKQRTFGALVKAIGFVSEKASVADARAKMGSIKDCNDVFVTPSGDPGERATGWLTNTLLAGLQ
jgi:hypothetical protein